MKRILVTGGLGFIGSHTSLELLRKGYEIIIVDSLINSFNQVFSKITGIYNKDETIGDKIKFFKCDLCDFNSLRNIFERTYSDNKKIDAVIHFAGLKSVPESLEFPLDYWNSNVLGTVNLLNIMSNYECKNLVFSSSATIYGPNENNKKITEDDFKKPLNPYGSTKETIEKILCELKESNKNWSFAILRYFNPIGAHYSGLLGENPKNKPNNIMPIINEVALGKKEHVNIYGNNWDTLDGTPVRDYIHVMDLADGHIKSLEYLLEKKSDLLIVNLGTGIGTSVLKLIQTFNEINNIHIPYKFTSRRKGDIQYSVADNRKATTLLNWEPKRNIEDMCRDSWRWTSQNNSSFLGI